MLPKYCPDRWYFFCFFLDFLNPHPAPICRALSVPAAQLCQIGLGLLEVVRMWLGVWFARQSGGKPQTTSGQVVEAGCGV